MDSEIEYCIHFCDCKSDSNMLHLYTASQPPSVLYDTIEETATKSSKDTLTRLGECFLTDDINIAVHTQSSQNETIAGVYDTIDESQLTTEVARSTDQEVLHRNIETSVDNQASSVLYDTIEENTTEVLQSGSEPSAVLSEEEFLGIKSESELPITTENVAYKSSQSQPLLENVEPCAGVLTAVNLVQNIAYKPAVVPLSPNVAYESYVHQGTEN